MDKKNIIGFKPEKFKEGRGGEWQHLRLEAKKSLQ